MGILNALAAREDTQAPGRGSAASKQRGSKRSGVETETAAVDSPGPSPSDVRSSDQLRRVKGQGQRSSSVASQTPRDGSSRLDDGPDGSRTSVADRAKMLVLHAEVAYRQSKTTHDSDGERIHCTINGIRKDKGRYAFALRFFSYPEHRLNTDSVAEPYTISRTRTKVRTSYTQRELKTCFQSLLLEVNSLHSRQESMLLRYILGPQPFITLKSSPSLPNGTSTASNLKEKRTKRRSRR
jgi:hypothetical protein